MPILQSERTIKTKVRHITSQQLLLDMYNSPELIHELYIEGNEVMLIMENPYEKEVLWKKHVLGTIKDEYLPLLKNERHPIKQWRLVGGNKIHGYGDLYTPLCLNITIYF